MHWLKVLEEVLLLNLYKIVRMGRWSQEKTLGLIKTFEDQNQATPGFTGRLRENLNRQKTARQKH